LLRYLAQRFAQAFVTLLLVTLLVFTLVRLTGDPVPIISQPEATEADRNFFRIQYGLDRSLPEQYLIFVGNLMRGDFGVSFRLREPALGVVVGAIGPTLKLTSVAMLISIVIGLPLGIVGAVSRRRWVSRFVDWYAGIGQAVPPFWIGLMLVTVFAVWIPLLPSSGYGGWSNYVLPGLTLASFTSAAIARLTQTNMREALRSDFVHLERMMGLSEPRIVLKHALRNASLPIITYLALQFGLLLGGAIVTERVFAWPGIGQIVVDAILNRDYPVVQATVMITAALFIVINLTADVLYTVLDPRVRV